MATFKLLTLFLLLSTFQLTDNSFDFKEDLERDKRTLKSEHHFSENSQVQQFEKFKNIRLSEFKFSFQKEGTTILKKWKRSSGVLREFYQIDCKINVDTVVVIKDIDTNEITERISVKGTFNFRTYLFHSVNKPKDFYYMTDLDDGLVETKVDEVHSDILYETIAVGSDIAYRKAKTETDRILKRK